MPIRLAQLRQEPNQPANRAVRRIATASDWLSRANRFLIARAGVLARNQSDCLIPKRF